MEPRLGVIRAWSPIPDNHGPALHGRERRPYMTIVRRHASEVVLMSRYTTSVLAVALHCLAASGPALAQLTPQAGSAGAGGSAVSGIPFGPANPSVLSDPSGIGNAAKVPPLGSNVQPPPTSYGSVYAPQPSRTVVVRPPYAGASQRIISAQDVRRRMPPHRRHRPEKGFTGICRGC